MILKIEGKEKKRKRKIKRTDSGFDYDKNGESLSQAGNRRTQDQLTFTMIRHPLH